MKIRYIICLLVVLRNLSLTAQVLDSQIQYSIVNKMAMPIEIGREERSDRNILKVAAYVIEDKDYNNRYNGYRAIYETGTKTRSLAVKKEACKLLLKSASDTSHAICKGFHLALQHFEKEAFDEDFKKELSKLLHDKNTVNKGLVLLIGFLGMKEEMGFIKENYVMNKNRYPNEFTVNDPFKTIHYAAKLSLARMGDEESANSIFSGLDSLSEDEIVQKRLEDIAYMRNNYSIEILIKYLRSEAKLPAYTGSYSEPYAWKAIYQLAWALKGFPVKRGPMPYYSPQEVAAARDWIAANELKLKFEESKW